MVNRIKELREELGLTLEQVADTAGTSVQQVSRLERGERRLTDDWMRRISAAFGVQPAALMPNPPPDHIKVVQQPKKLRLRPDELRLVAFWRKLGMAEKRMIAALARDKGLEILADDSESRSA